MDKLTKIIATLGPASDSPETIEKLINAGVNVFRFNMKHADIAWHQERIDRAQKVADSLKRSIGILIDLQGPELRIETVDHLAFQFREGDEITVGVRPMEGLGVFLPHPVVFDSVEMGDVLFIDDGFFEFEIVKVNQDSFVMKAKDDGSIGHRKGVNIPNKHLDLPSLIDDDLHKLDMASVSKVDFVALSFSRTKKDIDILRKEMEVRKIKAKIIAKVESRIALDHLDELIESADGIMVARGDLGIEVPIEELAYWQKTIIRKCRIATKPVITATQMLQSMTVNPLPTRAEAVDVANAIFDGTDAIMLSAESASGKYPVKAVAQMAKIARFCEPKAEPMKIDNTPQNQTELMIHGVMAMLDSEQHPSVDKIIVFTESGYTAKVLASLRIKKPVVAISRFDTTIEQLSLSFGIDPYYMALPGGYCDLHQQSKIFTQMKRMEILKTGEKVMLIHGNKWQEQGNTNTVAIVEIQ